jgi:hypothetical protein
MEAAERIGKMAMSKFDAGLHYFFPLRTAAGFCSRPKAVSRFKQQERNRQQQDDRE